MLDWVNSKSVGGVSEVTLFTPIKKGFVPGELRTYVERLDTELQLVQQRIDQRLPTPIDHLPTIHFARWLILRPNQYLCRDKNYLYCRDKGNLYCDEGKILRSGDGASGDAGAYRVKVDLDTLTSWLFFTSNFDGDMKTYLRDFSVVLGDDVDRIWGNCEGYPPGGSRDFDAYGVCQAISANDRCLQQCLRTSAPPNGSATLPLRFDCRVKLLRRQKGR